LILLNIVILDKDFAGLAAWRGSPPKVIWLRCGNSTVVELERLLRSNILDIHIFETHPVASVLEIWP
jgi:predicted nuclease of predicted toxin-antitoxin system